MLNEINLSLSSACSANCIFCPLDRGQRIKEKIMPFETVKKIIDEVASESFQKQHAIHTVHIGENGDCFLNPKILQICRYIKKKLPNTKTRAFTNFANCTPKLSEKLLKEKLIDIWWCNIDGKDGANYYHVKGLDLRNTMKNIVHFLNIRDRQPTRIPLTVTVCTLHNYIHKIHDAFGFYPTKLKDIALIHVPDDYKEIKKIMYSLLKEGSDSFGRTRIFGWAEREKLADKRFSQDYICPHISYLERAAYFAPDGSWYACCLDSNNEILFGNVHEESINDMYFGEKRRTFLELLKAKKYNEIGGPCKTIIGCMRLQ